MFAIDGTPPAGLRAKVPQTTEATPWLWAVRRMVFLNRGSLCRSSRTTALLSLGDWRKKPVRALDLNPSAQSPTPRSQRKPTVHQTILSEWGLCDRLQTSDERTPCYPLSWGS